MPVRQQAAGCDGFIIVIIGNRVNAHGIALIPFEFDRNALLNNEDFHAQTLGIIA